MKTLQTIMLAMASISLFAACESSSGQTQALSNEGSRRAIMNTIANDSTMSREMMSTMMKSKNGKYLQPYMMGNQNSMMRMLKGNPAMMQSMMSAIMETAKGDTSRMSGIIKMMSGNPQMMRMMQNMQNSNRLNGMGHMNRMKN